jgi:hypothetical protein
MTADPSPIARNRVAGVASSCRDILPTAVLTRLTTHSAMRVLGGFDPHGCQHIALHDGVLAICGAPRKRGSTYCTACLPKTLPTASGRGWGKTA